MFPSPIVSAGSSSWSVDTEGEWNSAEDSSYQIRVNDTGLILGDNSSTWIKTVEPNGQGDYNEWDGTWANVNGSGDISSRDDTQLWESFVFDDEFGDALIESVTVNYTIRTKSSIGEEYRQYKVFLRDDGTNYLSSTQTVSDDGNWHVKTYTWSSDPSGNSWDNFWDGGIESGIYGLDDYVWLDVSDWNMDVELVNFSDSGLWNSSWHDFSSTYVLNNITFDVDGLGGGLKYNVSVSDDGITVKDYSGWNSISSTGSVVHSSFAGLDSAQYMRICFNLTKGSTPMIDGFVFGVSENRTPSMDSTSPVDGASGVATSLSYVNATLSDSEGDTMNWSIETSPDIGNSSGTDEGNGTKSCSVSGLSSATTYMVYVNVSDSAGNILNETFTFTTYGLVTMYCYNESSPGNAIDPFYLEITNSDASETYLNTSFDNGGTVGFDELPSGDNVYFLVNASGYKSRLYNFEIDEISDMSFTFYLYPEVDSDLTYRIVSVGDYTSDETVSLGCEVDEVVFVEVYNSSTSLWVYVAEDKYDVSGNSVIVNETVLDVNSSMIRVSFYCIPLSHYILNIIDETGSPIDDAYINIERLISSSYEVVVNGYSDGGGNFGLDLLPGINYRVNITHSSYENSSSFWQPPEILYEGDAYKTFVLKFEDVTPSYPDNPSDCISVSAEIGSSVLYVNYSCSCPSTEDVNVKVFMINLSSEVTSLFGSDSSIDSDSQDSVFSDINNSNSYVIYVYYNHSYWGGQLWTKTIVGTGVVVSPTSGDEIISLFDALYGTNPFGWHNFLMFLFLMSGMYYADQRDAGKVLLVLGGLFLFINVWVGFESNLSTVAGGGLPILFIVVGVIQIWNDSNRRTG